MDLNVCVNTLYLYPNFNDPDKHPIMIADAVQIVKPGKPLQEPSP